MSYKKFTNIPNLEKAKSLLCIQPHPDDNEVGAGATIYKMAQKGCIVNYLTVTDGKVGTQDSKDDPEKLKVIRSIEQKEAGDFLGVKNQMFLDYEDGGDYSIHEVMTKLIYYIRKLKPEFIMSPDPFLPYEVHPDHNKTGLAALRAALLAEYPHYPNNDKKIHDSWKVKGVALYNTRYPNTYIDVEKVWDKKIKALSLHKSQFNGDELDMLIEYFTENSKILAKKTDNNLVESFKVMTTMQMHCFVNAIDI